MIGYRFFFAFCLAVLSPFTFSACSSGTDGTAPTPGACAADTDCDDNNACTTGLCKSDGTCEFVPRSGETCDDGDACTADEVCSVDGVCGSGVPLLLDNDPCQTCSCDPKAGVTCDLKSAGDTCTDSNCCTLSDTCQVCDPAADDDCPSHGLTCTGDAKSCFDDDTCTKDQCECDDNDNASCVYPKVDDGTACDGNPNDCTAGDQCLGGQCILGDPLPLNDNNPCTKDTCVKGEIKHDPIADTTVQCDDGDECTGGDHCYLGSCIGGDQIDCALPSCGSSVSCINGQGCVVDWMPEGAACDDGNACSKDEVCNADHKCASETFKNCDDGNLCTTDACNPDGGCSNTADPLLEGTSCPAEAKCGAGVCKTGTCAPADVTECDDANPCTDDTCDPTAGCTNTPNAAQCDDGDTCTTGDSCILGDCTGLPATTSEFVTCSQKNALDSDGCCCKKKDPTGAYLSAHVLDMGDQPAGIGLDICLTAGFMNGCKDTAYIDVSEDGVKWTNVTSFSTTSKSKPGGGWEQVCLNHVSPVVFKYIRGANTKCYVDQFKVGIDCGLGGQGCNAAGASCDDGNNCTTDTCDAATGACVYQAIESANCLKLQWGNNLISFSILPDDPLLAKVMGANMQYVNFMFSEAQIGIRLTDGSWIGNLHTLERTRGYWINMGLPTGTSWVAIELLGTPTDPDISYQLHKGVNSISFPSPDNVNVSDAIYAQLFDLFKAIIGQGIATFYSDSKWIGSLTQFRPNKGYEVVLNDDIPEFQFLCPTCDGNVGAGFKDGCIYPTATNYDPAANINDQSCKYDVPAGWQTPKWDPNKDQGFVIFKGLTVDGAPLEPNDAVGAFSGTDGVGFGFKTLGYTTVPIIGKHAGETITFVIYDVSKGQTVPIDTVAPIVWDGPKTKFAGCTDPTKANYFEQATISTDTCQ